MVFDKISLVNSHPFQHLGSHLIGGQILILLLQSHIIPDDILGLEEVAILHLLGLQPHGRQVIAIHDQYHRLRIFCQGIRQFLEEGIHLMDLIAIIFPGIIILLSALRPLYGNGGLVQHRFRGIIPMPLDGNGIDIIPFLGGIQAFQNLLRQDMVLQPAGLRGICHIRHIFLGGEGVEAQHGKYLAPGVKIRLVVMDGMGGISQILQDVGNTLAGFFLQNRLVRILSRPEIAQTHPGDRFKFCIGCSRPDGGHPKVSRRIFLHHPAEVGNGILRNPKKIHLLRVKKGFQLQEDDIGQL